MTLKAKTVVTYILPMLIAYGALITALSMDGRSAWFDIILHALPASLLPLVCSLLQDLVPKSIKEFLVFFRLRDRLPGHRAYTGVCVADPRIPARFLAKMRRETASKPNRQNVKWYGQYRAVSTDPSVEHENFRYLAWRDLTSTFVILGLVSPLLVPMNIMPFTRVVWVVGGCLAGVILAGTAARHAATSLVRNVVSLSAAKGVE